MIKMRLGGSNDPLEPFPQKPRGMHWRTYLRLRDQANAAEAAAMTAPSRPARSVPRQLFRHGHCPVLGCFGLCCLGGGGHKTLRESRKACRMGSPVALSKVKLLITATQRQRKAFQPARIRKSPPACRSWRKPRHEI
jgi:hypothetical protein